jgi:uncharacterized protein YxjI
MFTKNTYLIKERFSLLKVIDRYDIFDIETGSLVAYAKENIPHWKKALRLVMKKSLMSTQIDIRTAMTDELVYRLQKPFAWLRPSVHVYDAEGRKIGHFRSRILTLGGRFDVFSAENKKIAEVKGNWTGWNFKFVDKSGKQIGEVTKKWAGIGKEFFTNSDNYVVSIDYGVSAQADAMALLIIAGLAIDVVYKEQQ